MGGLNRAVFAFGLALTIGIAYSHGHEHSHGGDSMKEGILVNFVNASFYIFYIQPNIDGAKKQM